MPPRRQVCARRVCSGPQRRLPPALSALRCNDCHASTPPTADSRTRAAASRRRMRPVHPVGREPLLGGVGGRMPPASQRRDVCTPVLVNGSCTSPALHSSWSAPWPTERRGLPSRLHAPLMTAPHSACPTCLRASSVGGFVPPYASRDDCTAPFLALTWSAPLIGAFVRAGDGLGP